MKRSITLLSLVAVLALAAIAPAAAGNGNAPGHAASEATVRGAAGDPQVPNLGQIDYLFNKSGYHFWFTATGNVGSYVAGDSYHNVYKYSVEDPENWCGPVNIPNRAPYNAGGTAGQSAYYKIWNVTTESWVCGSD